MTGTVSFMNINEPTILAGENWSHLSFVWESLRDKVFFGLGVGLYATYVFVYFRYRFRCFSFTDNRNILEKMTGETCGGLQ